MALRRGGKKLPMEDVCYYHWPLPGTDQVSIIMNFTERCYALSSKGILILLEWLSCSLDCLASVMDMVEQQLQNLPAS